MGTTKGSGQAAESMDLNESIGELLSQESEDDTLSALDNVSADVINLITLIYQAIMWKQCAYNT